jgi:hypothetical protein
MDKSRLGQKKEQAVENAGGNNVEAPDDGVNNLGHETGGAADDRDSNLSAEAGNPNGRGAGKDPGPLTHETDRHDSQSRDEQARERVAKERGTTINPDTGARRGDLDAAITDRGADRGASLKHRHGGGVGTRHHR